jgi:hypothetical protein
MSGQRVVMIRRCSTSQGLTKTLGSGPMEIARAWPISPSFCH